MQGIRKSIEEDRFDEFVKEFYALREETETGFL